MDPIDRNLTPIALAECRQRFNVIGHLAERAQHIAEKTSSRTWKEQGAGEPVDVAPLLIAAGRLAELGALIHSEALAIAADLTAEDQPWDAEVSTR